MDTDPEDSLAGVAVLKAHKFSSTVLTKECLWFLGQLHSKFELQRKQLLFD